MPPLGKTRCIQTTWRSLYDSDDGAGSSASATKSKRHKRRVPSSPECHRKSKKHKRHQKHKKRYSKAFSAHPYPLSSSTSVPPRTWQRVLRRFLCLSPSGPRCRRYGPESLKLSRRFLG
ncbi:hypothetical protein JG687_00013820 [Phytophthora cactorum]|uniref:Uncharacterized protein n=1 Tax=Phytophthora cactorum TaxID=29920 RepID=A0A8T1U0A4_9STRA|nr:hypothetical protein JG687_00013820 [Phytophthora cactorum]